MIYILECDSSNIYKPESLLDAFIDDARLKKVAAYRFSADRMRARLAVLLLRFAYFREYGSDILPEMTFTEAGKPYFKDSNVRFNFSHTEKGVICSLSDAETGADIESMTTMDQSVAEMVLSKMELEQIQCAPEAKKNELFTMLWTAKEAYGKYLGCGLLYDMKNETFEILPRKWIAHGNVYLYSDYNETYAFSVACSAATDIIVIKPDELVAFFLMQNEME
jgi:phosphopantetheine--protein transferase-like protein